MLMKGYKMQQQIMIRLVFGMLVTAGMTLAVDAGQLDVSVPRCVRAPAIDGKITEEEWANAAAIELKGAAEPTRFKIMFDDKAIYLAAECGIPKLMSLPPAPEKAPERDSSDIWKTDHLELWLQPDGKDSKKYQFAVSDQNGIADLIAQPKEDRSYNPDWSHAVGRNESGWTAELAIPKAALQSSELKGNIGFNIGRDGPIVKECSWSGNWGDTSQKIRLEGVKEEAQPPSSAKADYGVPGKADVSGVALAKTEGRGQKASPFAKATGDREGRDSEGRASASGTAAQKTQEALKDRYVVNNNPQAKPPYDTWANAAADIQSAVNYAQVDETIWVSNGTYLCRSNSTADDLTAMVVVTKAITLKSVNGPAVTIVDGNFPKFTNRCFYLKSGVVLDGFMITNGHAGDIARGGGVYIASSGRITNCWITGNSTTNGQLIKSSSGGAVWCDGIGEVLNCRIYGNSSASCPDSGCGGGVFFTSGGGVIRDCIISNNYASSISTNPERAAPSYAVVCINYSDMLISNCTVIDNTGIGISIGGLGSIPRTIDNCRIIGNKGYGLMIAGSNGIVRNCQIINNVDWGVHMMHSAQMSNCVVSSTKGGGVWINYGSDGTVVQNCMIVGNNGTDCGGGVYLYGGILRNCLIASNNVDHAHYQYGGGIYAEYVGIDTTGGDANWKNWNKPNGQTARVENCTIVANRAKTGGGIQCARNCTSGSVVVVNTICYGNEPDNVREKEPPPGF
jgi:hypothetical protein